MSELDIYGNPISPPVRTVLTFCRLSEIAYTFHEIYPLAGHCSTEEYKKINPFEQIPGIVHNGYNLWESAAIVEYLADAYNIDNQWIPKDIKIRGRINAYLHSHHQGTRTPLFGYWVRKVIRPKYFGFPELTPETEAPFIAEANDFLERFNWALTETHYVARTSQATIADIFAHSEVVIALTIPISLESYPLIQAWYQEISDMPIVKEMDEARIEAIRKLSR